MTRLLAWMVLICGTIQMYGQFGLRTFYSLNEFQRWEEILSAVPGTENTSLYGSSFEFSVDYWVRPKNIRLEFYPEVQYAHFTSSVTFSGSAASYQASRWSAGVNTHLYLFDLFGDCECPTFSKEGNTISKGFFILLKPAYGFFDKKLNFNGAENHHASGIIQLTGGIGLDIGLSDLITITPIIQYSYSPGTDWPGFSESHGIIHVLPPDETTSVGQLQFGVRFGFRPDY